MTLAYRPSADKRQGRNHVLTKNPEYARCGKRGPFEEANEDALICGRCAEQSTPSERSIIRPPKGGWAKDGSWWRGPEQGVL